MFKIIEKYIYKLFGFIFIHPQSKVCILYLENTLLNFLRYFLLLIVVCKTKEFKSKDEGFIECICRLMVLFEC